jgi:hypothetical protein
MIMAPTNQGPWVAILERHCPAGDPPGWDDILAGYDFSLLPVEDIQRWAAARPEPGPAVQALAGLAGVQLAGFEAALWAAVREASGSTPRPGSLRWARAQDRWRLALLKDALAAPVTGPALAVLVEAIYIAVGCPEDMVDLWRRPERSGGPGTVDLGRTLAFIGRREAEIGWAAASERAGEAKGSGIPLGFQGMTGGWAESL